ncbi:MAG: DUF4282 domain-containing protein [Hyphomicrobiaceae bacterium]|nr:DUF4282 domain-containing protein [Hyphomicrobiaceae bacterium]
MLDDFRKLLDSNVLSGLDRAIMPRLMRLFYLTGLAAIGLWALNHLFFSFRFGFFNGLWGLLEIGVFGLLAVFVLRLISEVAVIFFRANANHTEPMAGEASAPLSLMDEVRGAIEDLAEDDKTAFAPLMSTPAATATAPKPKPASKPRRTARRAAPKAPKA